MRALLFIILSTVSLASHGSSDPKLGFLFGLDWGGEQLIYAKYTDGSTSDISAGDAASLGGGIYYPALQLNSGKLEFFTSVTYKVTSLKSARNAAADWVRVPIDLLVLYQPYDSLFRIGGGVTYSVLNKFTGYSSLEPLTSKFKNTFGFVTHAEVFVLPPVVSLSIRYNLINYQAATIGSRTIDGNSFSAAMNLILDFE